MLVSLVLLQLTLCSRRRRTSLTTYVLLQKHHNNRIVIFLPTIYSLVCIDFLWESRRSRRIYCQRAVQFLLPLPRDTWEFVYEQGSSLLTFCPKRNFNRTDNRKAVESLYCLKTVWLFHLNHLFKHNFKHDQQQHETSDVFSRSLSQWNEMTRDWRRPNLSKSYFSFKSDQVISFIFRVLSLLKGAKKSRGGQITESRSQSEGTTSRSLSDKKSNEILQNITKWKKKLRGN